MREDDAASELESLGEQLSSVRGGSVFGFFGKVPFECPEFLGHFRPGLGLLHEVERLTGQRQPLFRTRKIVRIGGAATPGRVLVPKIFAPFHLHFDL